MVLAASLEVEHIRNAQVLPTQLSYRWGGGVQLILHCSVPVNHLEML